MRERILLMLVATVVLVASFALAAFADRGTPGSTFPEQPGQHILTACEAVATHALGGPAFQHASPVALSIVLGLFFDACLGL